MPRKEVTAESNDRKDRRQVNCTGDQGWGISPIGSGRAPQITMAVQSRPVLV